MTHDDALPQELAELQLFEPRSVSDDPDQLLLVGLIRLSTAVNRALDAGAQGTGLSSTQIQILHFARDTRPEFATIGNLARVFGVTHVAVVRAARPLIERDLLTRTTGQDRRATHLALTDAGKEALAAADQSWAEVMHHVVLELPRQLVRDLGPALLNVFEQLAEPLRMSSYGSCRGCQHLRQAETSSPARLFQCAEYDVAMADDDMAKGCPHFSRDRDRR